MKDLCAVDYEARTSRRSNTLISQRHGTARGFPEMTTPGGLLKWQMEAHKKGKRPGLSGRQDPDPEGLSVQKIQSLKFTLKFREEGFKLERDLLFYVLFLK